MRPIDADEAKKQIRQMQALKPSEKMLLMLALDRTPTYEPPNDPLTLEELWKMDGEKAIGIKEAIAMDLEKYGDVKVLQAEVLEPEQMEIGGRSI